MALGLGVLPCAAPLSLWVAAEAQAAVVAQPWRGWGGLRGSPLCWGGTGALGLRLGLPPSHVLLGSSSHSPSQALPVSLPPLSRR